MLTEPTWFKGSLADMEEARRTAERLEGQVGTRCLVLRKDFVVDEYQVHEALVHGADTVLLIVAILSDDELVRFIRVCRELGMEPLVEAANEGEMARALRVGARVIGINNRDLTTFTLDLATTNRCAAMVPAGSEVAVLALSGLKARDEVRPYEAFPCIRGVLVGEALMRTADPAAEIRRLVVDVAVASSRTRVKICGVCRPEDALAACRANASFVGVIFADKSPRKVSVDEAKAIALAVRGFRESAHAWVDDTERKRAKTDALARGRALLDKAASRGPLLVGVFKDQSAEEVNRIAAEAQLDIVQLHGRESGDVIEQCALPVIKVVHVPADATALSADDVMREYASAAAVLLDTQVGTTSGGTGVAFAWKLARPLVEAGVAVFVAGGLNADNVAKAVAESARPFAVDCSSGVQAEGKPREKDAALMGAFVQRAVPGGGSS